MKKEKGGNSCRKETKFHYKWWLQYTFKCWIVSHIHLHPYPFLLNKKIVDVFCCYMKLINHVDWLKVQWSKKCKKYMAKYWRYINSIMMFFFHTVNKPAIVLLCNFSLVHVRWTHLSQVIKSHNKIIYTVVNVLKTSIFIENNESY